MNKVTTLIALLIVSLLPGCASTGGTDKKGGSSCHGAHTHDWKAWANFQPMSDKSVHVVGKVSVNSTGWTAVLTKRHPQGINPRILMLDLKVTSPSGNAGAVMLELDAKYSEKKAAGKYDTAEVYCEGRQIANVPVKAVH